MSTTDDIDNKVTLIDNSTDVVFSISQLINYIALKEAQQPYVYKELVVTKRVHKKQSKISAQHSLPIKKECQPQFKQSYKPNTYINTHHHVRSYR